MHSHSPLAGIGGARVGCLGSTAAPPTAPAPLLLFFWGGGEASQAAEPRPLVLYPFNAASSNNWLWLCTAWPPPAAGGPASPDDTRAGGRAGGQWLHCAPTSGQQLLQSQQRPASRPGQAHLRGGACGGSAPSAKWALGSRACSRRAAVQASGRSSREQMPRQSCQLRSRLGRAVSCVACTPQLAIIGRLCQTTAMCVQAQGSSVDII